MREAILARTMVELADTLVDDFDVVDLLTLLVARTMEICDVGAVGILLASPTGDLRVVASSSETMRMLELFELQADEGPCMDAYRTGLPVVNHRLDEHEPRWPRFVAEAAAAGFSMVHAVPMHLRGAVIGAMNLFHEGDVELTQDELTTAQALADVATIAVLQHRAMAEAQLLNEQLQQALNSRIAIEQAKGMIAEALGVDMDVAFNRLRGHARQTNRLLVDIARAVVEGDVSPRVFGVD